MISLFQHAIGGVGVIKEVMQGASRRRGNEGGVKIFRTAPHVFGVNLLGISVGYILEF